MEAWMNQTWWLYDLTVLAILILCVWSGWQRGLLRSIAGLLGYGAAALLAGILAQPAAEYVYDRWLAEPCAAVLEQKLEEYHLADTVQQMLSSYGVQLDNAVLQQIAAQPDQAADALYSAVSQETGIPTDWLKQGLSQSIDSAAQQMFTGLPEWMTDALLPSNDTAQQQNRAIQSVALVLSSNTEDAAEKLTALYLRPVMVPLIKTFTFSVLFLLISALLQVIIKCISSLRRTETGRLGDQTIGAAVGCVQAVLLLVMMGKLTGWIVEHGAGQLAFFNEAVIGKSVLFQSIYHIVSK